MGEILNVSRVGAPTTMRGTVALLIAFGCTADALKLSAPRSSARPVVARARAVVACEAEEPKKLKKPKVESEASRRAALMKENERAYNEEEEKACRQRFEPPLWDNRLSFFPHTFPGSNRSRQQALRICRIEFAPYPAGKYNKMASDEEGGVGKAAAYDQVRKDLPALASWSDLEIESTFTALKTTPTEILAQSPIGPFIILSGIAIWRDGLAAWNIPPCKEYLSLCEAIPTFQPFAN